MESRNSIFFLFLLFLGTTQAAIAMQENLNQIATEVIFFRFLNWNEMLLYQVVDKVGESKEKCCQYCGYLVCIALFFLLFTGKKLFGWFFLFNTYKKDFVNLDFVNLVND